MSKLTNWLKRKAQLLLDNELQRLKYSIGQSSILASRANSRSFIHLWDSEVKVFSQWGEDGILDYLCECLDLSKPRILEIGAGNFTECNSRFLVENRSASAYAVDGRNDLIFTISRSPLIWKSHLFGLQAWVTPENIEEIISNAQRELGALDIFSIDLDGNDYWILEKANIESFQILVVEYNPLFGHTKSVTVPRNDFFERGKEHFSSLYYGASLKSFKSLLSKRGFEFIGTNRVGNNAFFVNHKFAAKVPIRSQEDLSIYTDWRVRESRSIDGSLSLLSGFDRIKEIKNLPLIDLDTGLLISVEDAHQY